MHPYVSQITATDAHVSGEPIRVIPSEELALQGSSIVEKREFFSRHLDYLRQALIMEPRGHENMFGAVACPPQTREGDLGLFFMDTTGYLNMCGHGTIGSVTILLEKKMISSKGENLTIETPSGLIRAKYKMENGTVKQVSFKNVPAFVHKKEIRIDRPGLGPIKADIVFSGNFFIMIDAAQLPCDLTVENLNHLISEAMEIKDELNDRLSIGHPLEPHITGMDLVQFYELNPSGCHKNCVIFGKGQVDRSPCGTGVSGLLALLTDKDKLIPGDQVTCRSILGTTLKGKVLERTNIDSFHGIIPEISGRGFITGTHEFLLSRDDPFKEGFLM